MVRRNAFLTPDLPADDIICRPLLVPVALLSSVGGALSLLTKEYNWEDFGTMSSRTAAELCAVMLSQWEAECEDMACCPLRFNPNTGALEQYDPETETWDEIPFAPVLPGAGSVSYPDPAPQDVLLDDFQQRCQAAANAAIVMQQFYQETWDVLVSGTAGVVFGLISLLSGFVDTILGGRGAITAITQYARDTYEQGDEFTEGGFPDTALIDIQNIIVCHTSVTDDVVTFDHAAILSDFGNAGLVQPYLGLLVLMTTFFTEDALNVAGGVPVADADADCTLAECQPCVPGSLWSVYPAWTGITAVTLGSYFADVVQAAYQGFNPEIGYNWRWTVQVDLGAEHEVTSIGVDSNDNGIANAIQVSSSDVPGLFVGGNSAAGRSVNNINFPAGTILRYLTVSGVSTNNTSATKFNHLYRIQVLWDC